MDAIENAKNKGIIDDTTYSRIKQGVEGFGNASGKFLRAGVNVSKSFGEATQKSAQGFVNATERTGRLLGSAVTTTMQEGDPQIQKLKKQTFSQDMNRLSTITNAVKKGIMSTEAANKLTRGISAPTSEELRDPSISQALKDSVAVGLGFGTMVTAAQGVSSMIPRTATPIRQGTLYKNDLSKYDSSRVIKEAIRRPGPDLSPDAISRARANTKIVTAQMDAYSTHPELIKTTIKESTTGMLKTYGGLDPVGKDGFIPKAQAEHIIGDITGKFNMRFGKGFEPISDSFYKAMSSDSYRSLKEMSVQAIKVMKQLGFR